MMKNISNIIQENKIELLIGLVEKGLRDQPLRCYLKPAKINGHDFGFKFNGHVRVGYAQTFKIVPIKRRKMK